MIIDRLNKLRNRMNDKGIDVCIIPTADSHESEYVADYFKVRQFFSGFDGSAGTLIVASDKACLYTDSRYFIQAEAQLANTGIELMKAGLPDTIDMKKLVKTLAGTGGRVGFDGRVINYRMYLELKKYLEKSHISFSTDFDPAQDIWNDRPRIDYKGVEILDIKYSGENASDKIERILQKMDENSVDMHVVSRLDEIAWITNLRGNDIECNPVFYAFMLISKQNTVLYANIADKKIEDYLNAHDILLRRYDDFYTDGLKRVNNCTLRAVLLDNEYINSKIINGIDQNIRIVSKQDPAVYMKAVKNDEEIEAIRSANIKDGVACVRFNRYLKSAVENEEELTELLLKDKLYEFRSLDKDMLGDSFETICAYGEHGAIVHYSATRESNIRIGKGSFLLIDSGAQYPGGTTDVTRTYPIGEVEHKLKQDYTTVLRAMLNLMSLVFPVGCVGQNLDMAVRMIFWEKGLDFGHGTGHGIGAGLNVHEDPVRIHWRYIQGKTTPVILEPGMLSSDEPGLYIEGKYGIRIETDILCVEKYSNEYGRFLGFEPITYVPIDTGAILVEEMSQKEIDCLNRYHEMVFDKLSPYLSGDDLQYLRDVTKPL